MNCGTAGRVPVSSLKLTSNGYVSPEMGDCFGALLVFLMALWHMLVDRNLSQPCFTTEHNSLQVEFVYVVYYNQR